MNPDPNQESAMDHETEKTVDSSKTTASKVDDVVEGAIAGVGGKKSPWRIVGFVIAVTVVGLMTSFIYDALKPTVAYSARVGLEEYAAQYNHVIQQGVDPRDIENYLQKLTDVPLDEREDFIEKLYEDKEIELPLREAMLLVIQNMDENVANGNERIESLKMDGDDKLASALVSMNDLFLEGDIDNIDRKSRDAVRGLSDTEEEIVYMEIAEKYESLYQLEKAEEYYEKVREKRRESTTETSAYADVLRALANVFYAKGEFEKARIYFGKGLDISDETGNVSKDLTDSLKSGYKLAQDKSRSTEGAAIDILLAKLGGTTGPARQSALNSAREDIPPRLTGAEAQLILEGIDPNVRQYRYAVDTFVPELKNPISTEEILFILGDSYDSSRQTLIASIKNKIDTKSLSANDITEILDGIDPDTRYYRYAVDSLK